MITNLTYEEFCREYYLKAKQAADVTIASFIKEHDQLHPSLDLDLIKDKAITLSLKKTYERFDSDRGKKASVQTFLSAITRNQVLTELRQEGKATGAGKKQSIDKSFRKGRNQDNFLVDEGGEMAQRRLMILDCIDELDPVDQIIIKCWMEGQKTYCSSALSKLGWASDRREEVQERKKKAFAQIKKLMEIKDPDLKNEDTPQNNPKPSLPDIDRKVYKHEIPLKNLGWIIENTKVYFGLYHPSLELEYALVGANPDRTFQFDEFVLYEEIETAFLEGGFICNDLDRQAYINLLWFIANLYYGKNYEKYQDVLIDEVSNELMWDAVYDDILHFYAFFQESKEEAPITVMMGKKKIVIKNTYRWFHMLMDRHLFPNCLPKIHSIEQALSILKKKPGRAVENKLAIAIINGIATLFAEDGLIKGKAPKNLCTFIKQYLILMEILDKGESVISENGIKSSINYAAKRSKAGDDPRLTTTDLEDVSLEDLATKGCIPGDDWLFHTRG